MVLNIDLLPTLLDLAGAPIPAEIQGQSFKPLEGLPVAWRKSFLYEYFMEEWVPGIPSVYAVRTDHWKYMVYPDIKNRTRPELYDTLKDTDELYDLEKDPNELHNLAENPEYKDQLKQMQIELDRLMKSAKLSP
jgi:arylsulfatase A-like enzyme